MHEGNFKGKKFNHRKKTIIQYDTEHCQQLNFSMTSRTSKISYLNTPSLFLRKIKSG